jgi:hypothetical protein
VLIGKLFWAYPEFRDRTRVQWNFPGKTVGFNRRQQQPPQLPPRLNLLYQFCVVQMMLPSVEALGLLFQKLDLIVDIGFDAVPPLKRRAPLQRAQSPLYLFPYLEKEAA